MRKAALLFALVVAVALLSAPATVADPETGIGDTAPASLTGTEALDDEGVSAAVHSFDSTPETEFRIELQPDRDADWTVAVVYELRDGNETAAFEAVGERFLDGEVGPSAELYQNLATEASIQAGREMEIVDASREVYLEEEPELDDEDIEAVGELRLAFTWTEFLRTDGDQLVMDDAFLTADNETWLRSLEANQRMVIRAPDGYTLTSTPGSVSVDLQENAFVIEGPESFAADDRVGIVYSPTGGPAVETPWEMIAAAIVVGAGLVAVGLVAYRRRDRPADASESVADPDTESISATGAGAGAAAAVDEDADTATEDDEDLSLLSDEERVERLLEREGGRMRQADIVQETGWSDAKVSQLLSAMAEAGRVEKLRLGRENLISLPDDGNEGAGDEGRVDENA